MDNDKVFGCSTPNIRKAAEYINVPIEALKMFSPKELRELVDEVKEVEREGKNQKHHYRRGSDGGVRLFSLPKAQTTTKTTAPPQSTTEPKGSCYWLKILSNRIVQEPIRAADRYLLLKDGETPQTLKQYSRFGLGDLVEEGYTQNIIRMRLTPEQLDQLFKKIQGRLRNPLMKIPKGQKAQGSNWNAGRELWQKENPEWKHSDFAGGIPI